MAKQKPQRRQSLRHQQRTGSSSIPASKSERLECPPASLWVRLAAIVYDGFLLGALFFITAFFLLAFNHGQALPPHVLQWLAFPLYLLVGFGYYAWFWRKGGRTLGMQSWHLRLVKEDGSEQLSWQQAGIRYLCALLSWTCLGLGFLWILLDRQQRAWHDIASRTAVVRLPDVRLAKAQVARSVEKTKG